MNRHERRAANRAAPISEEDFRIAAVVIEAILGSTFEPADQWSAAVVVVDADGTRATTRAAHAAWLDSLGLVGAARECRSRAVARGEILAWSTCVERPGPEHARFLLIDLASAFAQRERFRK